MPVINYNAVFYIGPNRDYVNYQKMFKEEPLFFVRHHVNFLNACENDIKSATFVFNKDLDDDLKEEIDSIQLSNMPLDIIYHNGEEYSYGGWNDSIKQKMELCEYMILIEDDYIPTRTDFYLPFLEKCTDACPYVCSLIKVRNDGVPFASSSNALIQTKACKEIYKKYGDVFTELNCTTLQTAWHTQMNFLNYFINEGFDITDITDKYRTLHMLNCNINQIVQFGPPTAEVLIAPIIV